MAPRFARHLSAAAPRILTAAAFAVVTAALVTPPTAQAQRHAGSVSVDLSVLDSLGTPQNVPQMLRPGVRSLLMPNVRQNGSPPHREPVPHLSPTGSPSNRPLK